MDNYRLSDILDIALLQKMADSHYRGAGMPIGIIDAADNSVLIGAGWQDICVRFHRANPVSLKRCQESDSYIKNRLTAGEYTQYKCKNGLWDIGIPIVVGDRHLATLFLGQFFYEEEAPDRAFFARQADILGFDKKSYLAALDRVPAFSREKVAYILEYNKSLAAFIADLSEQSLKRMEADAALQKACLEMEELVRARTAELFESEELHRLVLSSISDAVFLADADGRLVYICANIGVIFGYSVQEVHEIGNVFNLLGNIPFDPADLDASGEITNIEVEIRDKRGETRDLLVTVKKVSIRGGTVLYSCRDITARKLAEKELLNHQKQLQSLSMELLLVEERERRKLATDLHDSIAQNLALSKIKLALLRESRDRPDAPELMDGAYNLIDDVIQEARTLTFEISPPVLYELGFEPAVEWLVEDFQTRHGLSIDLSIDSRPKPLDDPSRFLLFRIFRELLMNVIKHAGTRTVTAVIEKDGDCIRMTVADDGAGFDASKFPLLVNQQCKYGLFSVQERVEHLQGTFDVASAPGQGCRVSVSLPLSEASAGSAE